MTASSSRCSAGQRCGPRTICRSASADRRRKSRARSDSDRKSTRLNSSHQIISYAVFCLKKKNAQHAPHPCLATVVGGHRQHEGVAAVFGEEILQLAPQCPRLLVGVLSPLHPTCHVHPEP